MASVGRLSVLLSASSADFDSGLDRATHKLDEFHHHAEKGESFLGSLLEFEGIRLAIEKTVEIGRELPEIFEQTSEKIISLSHSAERLGVSTEELGALGLAAKEAGVPAEVLDHALDHLQRKINEVANASPTAWSPFKELGLDVANLASMGAVDQLAAIGSAMGGIEDPSKRAALGTELFSRQYRQLSPILHDVRGALKDSAQTMRDHQSAISGMDVSTLEASEKSLVKLGDAWEGIKVRLTVALAPYITALADDADKFSSSWLDAGKVVAAAFDGIRESVVGVAKALDFFGQLQKNIERDALQIARAHSQHLLDNLHHDTLGDMLLGRAHTDTPAEKKKAVELQQEIDVYTEEIGKTEKAMQDMANTNYGDKTAAWFDNLAKHAHDAHDAANEYKFGQYDKAPGGAGGLYEKRASELTVGLMTPLEKFNLNLAELTKLSGAGAIDQETYSRGAFKYLEEISKPSSFTLKDPRAMAAGSSEAVSAILAATKPEQTIQQRMLRAQEEARRYEERIARATEQMANLLGLPPRVQIKPGGI